MSVSSPILPGETEPYYDLGSYHRPIETPSPQAQVWFDRGHGLGLRVQPRRGDPLLRPRTGTRPRPRDRALGRRLLDRTQLQQGVGGVRPRRPGRVAGPGADGTRAGRQGPRVGRRTRADRGAAGPLPHRRPGRRRRAAGRQRRLRRRDGGIGRGVSRRHRRAGAGRRRAGQPHRMGVVGHQNRRACARLAGGGGQADPRRGAGHPGRSRTPRRPASLPAHHGDVGQPAGRAARRGSAARTWCPTPATCSTCPATSTCCAATTATRWCRI